MAQATTHKGDLIDVLVKDPPCGWYESGGLSDEHRRALVDHIIDARAARRDGRMFGEL